MKKVKLALAAAVALLGLDRLKQDYYVTDAQKAEMQGYVNELK